MPVQKVCVVCGSNFKVAPARAETAKTCSRKCKNVQMGIGYSDVRIKTTCKQCGKPIEVSKGRFARGNGRFCSKKCQADLQRGIPFTAKADDGTVTAHSGGYILERCDEHPFAVRGTVLQHRLVMECRMREEAPDHPFLIKLNGGLYLDQKIHVHHINEIKSNNRRDNLIACTSSGHRDLHRGLPPMKGETWPEPDVVRERGDRYVDRTCEACQKVFTVSRSTALRSAAKYCSRECASGYVGDLPVFVERHCLCCKKQFLVKRWKVINGTGKYCSNTCRHEARKGVDPKYKRPYQ